MQHSFELSTSRLILIGADSALLSAEKTNPEALATAANAIISRSWPPEHHDKEVIDWILESLKALPPGHPWRTFYMMLKSPRTLIGTCGFKGPPDLNCCAEVGYSVLQDFRCRGLATEAVLQLIHIAFGHGASEVAAETFPSLSASLRVMEKCGMTLVGEGADPGTVRYSVRR